MILLPITGIAVLDHDRDRGISRAVERDNDLASYDPRIRALLCPLIPVGGVVVDGGAFIGDHTVPYAETVGPTGQVWAFECGRSALECLRVNTAPFPQVRIVTAALADTTGAVRMQQNWLSESCNAISPRPVTEGIPAVPLDAFTFDRLDYVKLDVEGYELRALRGAARTLAQHHPVLVVESGRQLERYGDSHGELVAFLVELGYDCETLPYQQPYHDVFDLLCRPHGGHA